MDTIEYLLERGARIQAHDPQAMRRAEARFGNRIRLFDNKYAAVCGASALVIMTEWDAYKSPDYHELGERLEDRVIFDGRNVLDDNEVRRAGLVYIGIGRLAAASEASVLQAEA